MYSMIGIHVIRGGNKEKGCLCEEEESGDWPTGNTASELMSEKVSYRGKGRLGGSGCPSTNHKVASEGHMWWLGKKVIY